MNSRLLAGLLPDSMVLVPATMAFANGGTLIIGVEADQGTLACGRNPSLHGTNTATPINGGFFDLR